VPVIKRSLGFLFFFFCISLHFSFTESAAKQKVGIYECKRVFSTVFTNEYGQRPEKGELHGLATIESEGIHSAVIL
jgi:hypothetical protein